MSLAVTDKLLLSIITRNRPENFGHLIESIVKNPFLSECRLLVIDSSISQEYLKLNQSILKKYWKKSKYIYINREIWKLLSNSLISFFEEELKIVNLLKSIKIGHGLFDASSNRNVSMILQRICFPDNTYMMFFDDDIIIPEGFILSNNQLYDFVGFKVSGCPDFSRIQWIYFYLLFLHKKYKIILKMNKNNYVENVCKSLTLNNVANIVKTYTNLKISVVQNKKTAGIIFPSFDINTGIFILSSNFLDISMFPDTYSGLTIWKLNLNRYKINSVLNQQHVHHAASRKIILQQPIFNFELIGILVELIFRKSTYLKINKHNVEIIAAKYIIKIKRLLDLTEKLLDNVIDTNESQNLVRIHESLILSIELIETTDLTQCINFLSGFREKNKIWKNLFKLISNSSGDLKSILLRNDTI